MSRLCKRGIEAARAKFKVYPSAYANGYAVQVCQGRIKDLRGVKRKSRSKRSRSRSKSRSNLHRWYEEEWINVCESKFDKSNRLIKKVPCGRSKASKKRYPYCRPLRKRSKSTPRTVGSMSTSLRKKMCAKKRRNPKKIVYI